MGSRYCGRVIATLNLDGKSPQSWQKYPQPSWWQDSQSGKWGGGSRSWGLHRGWGQGQARGTEGKALIWAWARQLQRPRCHAGTMAQGPTLVALAWMKRCTRPSLQSIQTSWAALQDPSCYLGGASFLALARSLPPPAFLARSLTLSLCASVSSSRSFIKCCRNG